LLIPPPKTPNWQRLHIRKVLRSILSEEFKTDGDKGADNPRGNARKRYKKGRKGRYHQKKKYSPRSGKQDDQHLLC
jgi:hypothetical protein